MSRTTDNKTAKHKENKKDASNSMRKDGAGYLSQTHPYANSFRKPMADWMSVNFLDGVRNHETWPGEPGKRRPKSAEEQGPEPTPDLGWLDSLEDRDKAFCKQHLNQEALA